MSDENALPALPEDSTTVTPPGRSAPAWRRAPVGPVLLIWAVLTVLLLLFAPVQSHLMGKPASPTMQEIETTVTWFSGFSAPVAALVWSILLYSFFRWRHKGSEPPTEPAPQIRNNPKLFATWLVGSSLLCLLVLIWGLVVIAPREAEANPAKESLIVNVTAQQWAWDFTYPEDHNKQSSTLYLPVDEPVLFRVSSKDVVHSFWLVALGVKIDANPGETTTALVTPTQMGKFVVRCAELCGLYHSYMQAPVQVLSKAEFAAWAQEPSTEETP